MQKHEDFGATVEPMDLMIEAVREAAFDAAGGSAATLRRKCPRRCRVARAGLI